MPRNLPSHKPFCKEKGTYPIPTKNQTARTRATIAFYKYDTRFPGVASVLPQARIGRKAQLKPDESFIRSKMLFPLVYVTINNLGSRTSHQSREAKKLLVLSAINPPRLQNVRTKSNGRLFYRVHYFASCVLSRLSAAAVCWSRDIL